MELHTFKFSLALKVLFNFRISSYLNNEQWGRHQQGKTLYKTTFDTVYARKATIQITYQLFSVICHLWHQGIKKEGAHQSQF